MEKEINDIIQLALKEDLKDIGDVTTLAIFSEKQNVSATIKAKENGVIAGTYIIEPLFKYLDSNIKITMFTKDGNELVKGSKICTLEGDIHAILAGERTVLNLLQRLSGIATQTDKLVSLISKTNTKLLDTRKTTPGIRILEKKAVLAGGGVNHRFGLFDMILAKDTHVIASGGAKEAVARAKKYREITNKNLKIEVEVQNYEEFIDATTELPDRIMLDNMDTTLMKSCVEYIKKNNLNIETEASGNISETTIKAVAETGVDFISVGALTHSVKAIDIHLVIEDSHI